MKIELTRYLEDYLWLLLLIAVALALIKPVYNDLLMSLLEPALMLMLFLVFLKIDLVQILDRIRDYRLMLYLSTMSLLILPVVFYFLFLPLGRDLATGVLLLTAMPAGTSSPALTDIMRGNTPLAMGIAIVTALLAPFTVPILLSLLGFQQASLDLSQIFYSLALIVFVPMVLSQIAKRTIPRLIYRARPSFTLVNILILFLFVYTTIGSQRAAIVADPLSLLWDTAWLYILFILLHITGYAMAYGRPREDKIAITIGRAYMNNGMAMVLAAGYFEPSVLMLTVLSELPWNTLLGPFRRVLRQKPHG